MAFLSHLFVDPSTLPGGSKCIDMSFENSSSIFNITDYPVNCDMGAWGGGVCGVE
jgi:hypothetical protein